LLPWYDEHRRDLPWRRTRDPYRIWISEVVLQQTRVDQGLAYYERFITHFSTVAHLARARQDHVLKLWQGLGYYSRARNLHAAARQIAGDHRGRFPQDLEGLLRLKGVGEYTAAAIASIAFGKPAAVVDGNVYRVLSRVFGIDLPVDTTKGRQVFRDLAATLIDRERPGDHNQAVMELGATVCAPKRPDCPRCPLRSRCIARKEDRIDGLPVKSKRRSLRVRHFNYLHLENNGRLYMRRRNGGDVWQGLYEPPLIESRGPLTSRKLLAALSGSWRGQWKVVGRRPEVRCVLSHQVIHPVYWRVSPPRGFKPPADWKAVRVERSDRLPVPRPVERWLGTRRSKAQGALCS
jgi:A/G-specific adenine glycosylase